MTLLVQGMRRSGTTIVYDALLADPSLHCFYEPLREDDVTLGGGSGARDGDAFAETRARREAFRLERFPNLDAAEFNWGGPRAPELEVGPELPEHCRRFLGSLLEDSGEVAIKFTRVYDKLASVAELAPDAVLVHVVRDPRAVTASIMLGRGRRQAGRFETPDAFFSARSKRKLWSSRGISQTLLKRPEYAHVHRPSDVERVLLVWRHTFESTWLDGRRLFGPRYVLLRNEDLREDPAAALRSVYLALGRESPPEVLSWAAEAVRGGEEPYEAENVGWGEAFGRLGLSGALESAGYPELARMSIEPGLGTRIGAGARRVRRRLAQLGGR